MKRIFRIAFIISILTIILSGCSNESTKETTTKPQDNLGKTEYNTMVYNTLTSNEQIVYDQMLTGFQNTESPIAVSGTEAEIETAYDAIIADRPDIFYVEGYVYDTQTTVLSKEVAKEGNIYPNYTCSVDEYRQYLIRIHETMDTWFHDINQMTNDYEKSKYIFTELAKHNTYNKNANQGNNIISAYLYEGTRSDGYSKAYTYALQRYSIPCITVKGMLDDNRHFWNIAKLDDNYYLSDITNGDAAYVDNNYKTTNYINYTYLNMNPDHTRAHLADPIFANFKLISMDNNYYVKEYRYFITYDPDEVGNILKSAVNNNEQVVTLAFSSINVLNETIERFFNKNGMNQFITVQTIDYMTSNKFNTITLILTNASTKFDTIDFTVYEEELDELDIEENEVYEEELTSEHSQTKEALYYYNLVPENVRNEFEASDWTWFVYEDSPLNAKYGYSYDIMGITVWSDKYIAIDRRKSSATAIVHEIGHWSSQNFNHGINEERINVAYAEDWNKLYKAFGGSRKNYDTLIEFEASAFEYYVFEPDKLYEVAPYTYELMDEFINEQ